MKETANGQKRELCPRCYGGRKVGTAEDCPLCNGQPFVNLDGHTIVCERCDGTSQQNVTCPVCNGTGLKP